MFKEIDDGVIPVVYADFAQIHFPIFKNPVNSLLITF